MFAINIDKPKRKSYIKRKDVYAMAPVNKTRTCRHCTINDWEVGEYVCKKCFEVLDRLYVNENCKVKNSDMLIWNREYDKNRWIMDTVEYLHGEHNDCFDDVVWLDLLKEIPNPCIWSDVYHVFHYYRLTDYWLCFPSYVGIKISITKDVLDLVLKYADIGYTCYRISFMFLFYKFTQMINEDDAKYIPFKGTKLWIKKTDSWWEKVCNENEWTFYPTKMEKIIWDKDVIVKSLESVIEKKGQK